MPKPSIPPEFEHLETPVVPFTGLRYDPETRTYHLEDATTPRDAEPAERPGAART